MKPSFQVRNRFLLLADLILIVTSVLDKDGSRLFGKPYKMAYRFWHVSLQRRLPEAAVI